MSTNVESKENSNRTLKSLSKSWSNNSIPSLPSFMQSSPPIPIFSLGDLKETKNEEIFALSVEEVEVECEKCINICEEWAEEGWVPNRETPRLSKLKKHLEASAAHTRACMQKEKELNARIIELEKEIQRQANEKDALNKKLRDIETKFVKNLIRIRNTALPNRLMDEGVVRYRVWTTPKKPTRIQRFQRMLVQDALKNMLPKLPVVEREQPLSKDEWEKSFSEEGKLMDIEGIKKRIFFGGIEMSIRHLVWPYLLDVFPWDSTENERKKLKDRSLEEYLILKTQWTTITPDQLKHYTLFRTVDQQLEKDVVRTDRELPHFKNDGSPYLVRLREVLLTYCVYNWDLGYIQGMNDLLVPLLLIVDNEVDCFSLFKGLMKRHEENFKNQHPGVHFQSKQLEGLVKYFDPWFHSYLLQADAIHMLFFFRGLLLSFKREFCLANVQLLWETSWTNYLTPHFILFFSLALLVVCRKEIVENSMRFEEMFKYFEKLENVVDMVEVLTLATRLFLHFESNVDEKSKEKILGGKLSTDTTSQQPINEFLTDDSVIGRH